MTTETQTFIGVEDIKSVRIECSSCRTKTIVSLDTDQSRQHAKHLLSRFQCQHCKAEWFTVQDSSYLELLAKFIDAVAVMQDKEGQKMTMAFEITTASTSAS